MSSTSIVRIIIADDHTLFRSGVKFAFRTLKKQGFFVIGEAANGKELIELLNASQPDIVLMDAEMPVMDGMEATAIVKRNYPAVRTIALSYSDDSSTVLGMVSAGADGYLLKDAGVEELTRAIQTVHGGGFYFSHAATIHLANNVTHGRHNGSTNHKQTLTKRETEILGRICEGESSKEIAASLYVSKRTVDAFRENIMRKAEAKNAFQLLRYAIKNRLVKNF